LADLVNSAYRGAGGRRGWTHEAELIAGHRVSLKDIAAMIDAGPSAILIRRSDYTPPRLACTAVATSSADRCPISMPAVAPEPQGAGLGRALLGDAEEFGASKGGTMAMITVVEQRESLIAWYERRGYRRPGGFEALPYGDDSVGAPL